MIVVSPAQYVRARLKIFPCHSIKNGRCTCERLDCKDIGKHPRISGWQKQATSDLEMIQMWIDEWGDDRINWAMATGTSSGLWVVDIDQRHDGFTSWDNFEEERGSAFDTLKAITGGGGRHLFFKMPDDGRPIPNKVNWRQGVDVRGDGGYVILPQGRHASGGTYEWIDWGVTPPASAPLDLVESLRDGRAGSSTSTSKVKWSEVLSGLPEGERDNGLFAFACYLRRKLDDERVLVEPLVLEAARNCDPPFSEKEALVKVDQAFKQDHRDPDWMKQWATVFETGELHPDEKLYRETDRGNSERFADEYVDTLRFIAELGWVKWVDHVGWVHVSDIEIEDYGKTISDIIVKEAFKQVDSIDKQRMVKFALKSESVGAITAVVKLARSNRRLYREAHEFDTNNLELSCRNGILNLETGELRPLGRDDLTTKNTHIMYDPSYVLPEWEKFIEETTQGDVEMQEYLQRAAGYTLTGLTREECFFVITGPPQSGKSTYVDAMYHTMGDYATTTQSDVFMYRRGGDVPSNELARLVGTRMVSVSEIREGSAFNEALVKQLTGGDAVAARFLYGQTFSFTPRFKLWIATNHDPAAQDRAMMRRIKLIKFTHEVTAERRDPRLKAILKEPEVGGRAILAWAARGAQLYLREGKLVEPSSVRVALDTYRANNDTFMMFISEMFDDHGSTELTAVYSVYMTWCAMNGERPIRRPQFKQRMLDHKFSLSIDDRGRESFVGLQMKTGVTL